MPHKKGLWTEGVYRKMDGEILDTFVRLICNDFGSCWVHRFFLVDIQFDKHQLICLFFSSFFKALSRIVVLSNFLVFPVP